jgi:signal transduction histidine kinase
MDGRSSAETVALRAEVERLRAELRDKDRELGALAGRLAVLNEASHAFSEAVTDYPRLLSTVARRTAEILGDTCWIRLVGEDGEHFEDVALQDADPEIEAYVRSVNAATRQRVDEGVMGQVVRTGAPVLVGRVDAGTLKPRLKPEYRQVLDRIRLSSHAIAPLRARSEVLGIVFIGRRGASRPYDEADLALLVDLAGRAALAIDNARVYAELEARVSRRTAELGTAFDRLDRANKELEAFSYSVSHDLRTPLRAIDGFSRIVMDDFGAALPEEGRKHLQRVIAATRRMEQLIDDLLELARLGRGEIVREPVDVTETARAIAAELASLDPDRRVEWRIAGGLTALADERLVQVVLENLLSNAWKFTSGRAAARVEVGAVERDGRAGFFVRDDGAGFDMAYADKLFGAFQRLHTPAEFAGNGIGLATVRRIVERHGGAVWAEGAVGAGATFFFTL